MIGMASLFGEKWEETYPPYSVIVYKNENIGSIAFSGSALDFPQGRKFNLLDYLHCS
jgi:hypothetical protein